MYVYIYISHRVSTIPIERCIVFDTRYKKKVSYLCVRNITWNFFLVGRNCGQRRQTR